MNYEKYIRMKRFVSLIEQLLCFSETCLKASIFIGQDIEILKKSEHLLPQNSTYNKLTDNIKKGEKRVKNCFSF